ncbi:hypothetical protein [Nocardioides sp. HB32]
MSFWSWNGASRSSAFVDSALDGSHDEASLFWTSVSLKPRAAIGKKTRSAMAATTHLVTRLVRLPAI